MASHFSHSGLPYPVRNARFTVQIGYLDSTGTPTDPVTPDTEISKDGGAFTDCVEEVTVITGGNGVGYITLTGAEMAASMIALAAKVASGPKNSLIPDIRPRILPSIFTVTAVNVSPSSSSITLPTSIPRVAGLLEGCIIRTTGGAGGGGTGGANNQARSVWDFSSSGIASVVPDWEVPVDNTTVVDVLMTEVSYKLADLAMIQADDGAATRLAGALNSETLGVVGGGSTTTSIVTSSLTPPATVTSQFNGRIVVFSRLTTTANLRGQATKISASTAGGVLTVDLLTTAPVSGDVFCVV
jgi:hypothetical protein